MTLRAVVGAGAWIGMLLAGLAVLGAAEVPVVDGLSAGLVAVRAAGMIAGCYLLAVSFLRVGAAALRRHRLAAFADAITVPAARRILDAVVGVGALVAVAGGPAVAGAEEPPVLRHLEDGSASAEAPTATRGTGAPRATGATTWTVQAGDHFWSIAERVLGEALGRPPTEAEAARYWVDLVEANRSRLAHPDVADLIYPGQEFVLPPT